MAPYAGTGKDAEEVVGAETARAEAPGRRVCIEEDTAAVIPVEAPAMVVPVAAVAGVVAEDVGAFSNPFGGDRLEIVSDE